MGEDEAGILSGEDLIEEGQLGRKGGSAVDDPARSGGWVAYRDAGGVEPADLV
jgi:hypothetical protein